MADIKPGLALSKFWLPSLQLLSPSLQMLLLTVADFPPLLPKASSKHLNCMTKPVIGFSDLLVVIDRGSSARSVIPYWPSLSCSKFFWKLRADLTQSSCMGYLSGCCLTPPKSDTFLCWKKMPHHSMQCQSNCHMKILLQYVITAGEVQGGCSS